MTKQSDLNTMEKEGDNNTEEMIPELATTSEGFVARYNGPSWEDMTAEQRNMEHEIVQSRPRTGMAGPFGPWLAVPSIAGPSQALGKACRYDTSLSMRESELVILLTGARHYCHTEFDLHQGEALLAGIPPEIIQAIPRDDHFSMAQVEQSVIPLLLVSSSSSSGDDDCIQSDIAIVRFASELLETSTVTDETYASTKAILGGQDSKLVEITSIIGYYTYCAYTLNVFHIPSKKPS
mmetsp:Transcript_7420/g.13333  ORF Transcript_7420/g.13333 Transcript_7420/m.13333 type:complete len:236 (-) Transcript_7420:292-999(-)